MPPPRLTPLNARPEQITLGASTLFPRLAASPICGTLFSVMPFTLEDDLAQAARLDELTPEQTRLVLAVGLFAENRQTLAQAAALAGLDRITFQRHLAARGIPLHYGPEGFDLDLAAIKERPDKDENPAAGKPWLALRGSARFVGDPFAPVVSEEEISVLQKAESGVGS